MVDSAARKKGKGKEPSLTAKQKTLPDFIKSKIMKKKKIKK
jgi:hypothetical protein